MLERLDHIRHRLDLAAWPDTFCSVLARRVLIFTDIPWLLAQLEERTNPAHTVTPYSQFKWAEDTYGPVTARDFVVAAEGLEPPTKGL